jgi:hypothetical protein
LEIMTQPIRPTKPFTSLTPSMIFLAIG